MKVAVDVPGKVNGIVFHHVLSPIPLESSTSSVLAWLYHVNHGLVCKISLAIWIYTPFTYIVFTLGHRGYGLPRESEPVPRRPPRIKCLPHQRSQRKSRQFRSLPPHAGTRTQQKMWDFIFISVALRWVVLCLRVVLMCLLNSNHFTIAFIERLLIFCFVRKCEGTKPRIVFADTFLRWKEIYPKSWIFSFLRNITRVIVWVTRLSLDWATVDY